MKIRSQDGNRYMDYGEVYAAPWRGQGRAALYALNEFHENPVCIGIYDDMDRARGVLYEIGLAYQNGERVFYLPVQ